MAKLPQLIYVKEPITKEITVMHYFEAIEHDVTSLNIETAAYSTLLRGETNKTANNGIDFWQTILKIHRVEIYILNKRVFKKRSQRPHPV